mgnify:CR=1 FL=1
MLSATAVAPEVDATARSIAQALIEGFDKHYALFRDCARAAKRQFEAGNFRAIAHLVRDRIDFYDRRVGETAERIEREFVSAGLTNRGADALWARVKLHYIGMLIEHRQPECAETFFNSVSCKILHRTYFHNRFIFVRPAISTEHIQADPPTYRSYYPREQGLRSALIDAVLDFRFETRFADFRRDLIHLLAAFRAQAPRPYVAEANHQLQVLSTLFFRDQTAYAVGRASKVSKRPSPAKTSTAATLADRGPLRAQATTCSTACAGPATMASTDPSRRLRTQPRTPRHRACSTIDQR